MASRVSNLGTIAWQQRSIVRSNLGNIFESCRSNAIWLVTVKCGKSCDAVSFVKLSLKQRISRKAGFKAHGETQLWPLLNLCKLEAVTFFYIDLLYKKILNLNKSKIYQNILVTLCRNEGR